MESEKRHLSKLYESYYAEDLTFNNSVIKTLRLCSHSIEIKFGDVRVPCILYSTSMIGSRIIVQLSDKQLSYLERKNGSLSIKFVFKQQDNKNDIVFYINSKLIELEHYDEKRKDFYYCNLEFKNRAPDDLILIVGEYIYKQMNLHKRSEERFLINNNHESLNKGKNLNNYLFIAGNGKRAILTEISMFSAKLLVVFSNNDIKVGEKVMLIMKLNGLTGTGEMIGVIKRVEQVREGCDLHSVIVVFDQEVIPPSYKMWISEFIESVPKKR